jgi:hypothetical protein
MSVEFKCGDPAALAGYLYDECDAGERAAIEAHLAICMTCATELGALGATRTALASWTPPEAQLGFRVTRDPDAASVLHPPQFASPHWWQRPLPAWAQAAAAILIFAAGAGLGMRAGSQTPVPQAQVQPSASTPTISAQDLAALEQRLRSEMQAMRTSPAAQPARVTTDDSALLDRVARLVAESEARQDRELALRLTQVLRDVDSQRRMDLSRIERTFGQMEGLTRPELADQRQMINYLIQRTGAQRAPQE